MFGVLIILFHPIYIDLMLCHHIVLQTEQKKNRCWVYFKLLFSHVLTHPFPDISGEMQPWVPVFNSLILGITMDNVKKINASKTGLSVPLRASKRTQDFSLSMLTTYVT